MQASAAFYIIHINNYNTNFTFYYTTPNYCTTLRVRHHEERKTMTTPWPIPKDAQHETKIEGNITKLNYEYRVNRQQVDADVCEFAAMERLKAINELFHYVLSPKISWP